MLCRSMTRNVKFLKPAVISNFGQMRTLGAFAGQRSGLKVDFTHADLFGVGDWQKPWGRCPDRYAPEVANVGP